MTKGRHVLHCTVPGYMKIKHATIVVPQYLGQYCVSAQFDGNGKSDSLLLPHNCSALYSIHYVLYTTVIPPVGYSATVFQIVTK